MLGNKGQALRIHYRTDSGKLKKVLIASADSTALANAINKARSGGVADGVIFSETMGTEVEEVELVQEVEAVESVHA